MTAHTFTAGGVLCGPKLGLEKMTHVESVLKAWIGGGVAAAVRHTGTQVLSVLAAAQLAVS